MSEKPTIALCLEYPLALRGGVSVLVETLLPALSQQYRVLLVSSDNTASLKKSPAAESVWKHLPWEPSQVSPAASRDLAARIAAEGVALAHFHSGGNFGWGNRFPGHCPFPYLKGADVRVVSSVHLVVDVLDGYCGPQKPLWFKLALLPLAWCGKMQSLAAVQAEIAVSRHDCAKLQRWYWPLRGKFRMIYHSRLPENEPPVSVQRERTVLNVGHIAARKGQRVLAGAFAKIASHFPDWKLCLVGHVAEQAEAEAIQQIARAAGIEDRITLTGARDDAVAFMRRAGVYVQPSISEALGLALQEAMHTGCPSIGSRAGGIPELIDDNRTGLLVNPGNVAVLAAALEKLMSGDALREKLGRAGAESIVAKGMTVEAMNRRHLELYESILKNS